MGAMKGGGGGGGGLLQNKYIDSFYQFKDRRCPDSFWCGRLT